MDFSQSPPPPGLTGAWAKGKLQTAVHIREQKEREEAEAAAAAAEAAKTKRGLRSALSEAFTVSTTTTITPSKNIAKIPETSNYNNIPPTSSPSTTTSSTTPSASVKGNNNFKNTSNNTLFPSLLDSTTTTTTTTTIRPQVQQQLKDLEKRSNARMTLREREALKAHLKSMLRASDEHQMEVAARQEERRKKTQDRWNRGEVNPFQPSLIQLSDFANSNSNTQNNNNNNGRGNGAAVAAPSQQKKISVLSKDGTKASHIVVARKNQVEKVEESNNLNNENNYKQKNEKPSNVHAAKTSPVPTSNIAVPPSPAPAQQQQKKVVKLSSLTIVRNHKEGEDPMTVTKRLLEQQQQAELERKQKINLNNNVSGGTAPSSSTNAATGGISEKSSIIVTNAGNAGTSTAATTSAGATANSKPKSTVILGGGAALQQPLSDQKKKKKYSSQKHPTAMKRAVRRARRDLFAFYANDVEKWYNSLLVNENENNNKNKQENVRKEIIADESNINNKNQKKKETKRQKTVEEKKDDVDLFDMGDGFGEDVKIGKNEIKKPDDETRQDMKKVNNKNDDDDERESEDNDDYFENESSSSSSANDEDVEESGDDDDNDEEKDDFARIVMDVTLELAEEGKIPNQNNNLVVSQLPDGISPELIKKLHDQIIRTQKMVQNLQRQHDLVHNAFVSRDMDSIKKEVSRLKWKMRKMGKLQVPSQGGILSLHQNKIDEKQEQEKNKENSSIKNNIINENKKKAPSNQQKAKTPIVSNTSQTKIAAKQQKQSGGGDEQEEGENEISDTNGPNENDDDDDSKEQQAITQTIVSEKLAHLFYPRLWSYEGVGLHPNAAKVDQRIDLRKFGGDDSNNNNTRWPPGRLVRDYVTNILSRELDSAATKFLARLQAANSKLRTQQPLHYKARMRYVMGFREVLKGISTERVKFVILAPDVEPAPGTGGLDEHLMKILSACGIHYDATKANAQAFAANIPNLHDLEKEKQQLVQQQRNKNPNQLKKPQQTTEKEISTNISNNIITTSNALQYSSSHRAYQPRCIFAMSRLQLARVFHQKNRLVSIVGVFSADSAYDELKHMLAVASNNVELYKRMMDGEDITTMNSKTMNLNGENDDDSTE